MAKKRARPRTRNPLVRAVGDPVEFPAQAIPPQGFGVRDAIAMSGAAVFARSLAQAMGLPMHDPITRAAAGAAEGAFRAGMGRIFDNAEERKRTGEWLATLDARLVRIQALALALDEPKQLERLGALAVETRELLEGYRKTLEDEEWKRNHVATGVEQARCARRSIEGEPCVRSADHEGPHEDDAGTHWNGDE